MESQFSDDLYLRFRELLLTRAGLHYPERKRADLLHGLNMVLSAGSHASLAALYSDAVVGGAAWDLVLAHLTVGETYFFRNEPQFDALRKHILPDILQRRAATRTLRVWSAGCATGEEPYSLAMIIGDLLANTAPWSASILATDINPQFLARAQEGLYGEWSFRETPDELRARFWTREESRWRLRPEVRRMVSFARLNLAEPSYPSIVNGTCAIDLLVCRNVTIYFDERTTRQVVERFYSALTPGGWLIVGHSEPQASVYHQFEVHNFPNTVLYRKPLDAPMFTFAAARGATAEPSSLVANHLPRSIQAPPTAGPPARKRPPTAQFRLPEPKARAPYEPAPTEPVLDLDAPVTSSAAIATLVKLGRQCADRGDWTGATAYCEQALALDALRIDAHYLLAQIHEHQGMFDAALATYRRTVYLDRSFVPGLIGMGNIWRQIGRVREARRSYQTALLQLDQLPATAPVVGSEGATAGELITLINQQLRILAKAKER